MSGKKKRDIGSVVTVDGVALIWSVKSEPAWNTSDGDIGLRLSVRRHDDTLTRHGERKAWRELILQFPFERRQSHASRFPDKPKVVPETLVAAIKLAMEAGWEPNSRGRPFELVLDADNLARR